MKCALLKPVPKPGHEDFRPRSATILPLLIPANDNIKPILPAWMGINAVKTVQEFTITVGSGSTSNTYTLPTSVTVANAVIWWANQTTDDASGTGRFNEVCLRVALTGTNQVTATRGSSATTSSTVYGTVVEFQSSALTANGVQAGTISVASSSATGTATLSNAVGSLAVVFYLGFSGPTASTTSANFFPTLVLTNSTTVTATRNTATTFILTVGYAVVDFNSSVVNSVQARSKTLSTTTTSDTDTITSVVTANTVLIYNGINTSATAFSTFEYWLQLTSATQVTLSRGGTASGSRTITYTVLEFVSGVLNSAPQRGSISLVSVTSNTASLSPSISTTYGLVNYTGWSYSSGTNAPNTMPGETLTNASTITGNLNTSNANTTKIGYEAVEFTPPSGAPADNLGWQTPLIAAAYPQALAVVNRLPLNPDSAKGGYGGDFMGWLPCPVNRIYRDSEPVKNPVFWHAGLTRVGYGGDHLAWLPFRNRVEPRQEVSNSLLWVPPQKIGYGGDHLSWLVPRPPAQPQPQQVANLLAWVPPAAVQAVVDYLTWLAKTSALTPPPQDTRNQLLWVPPQTVGYGGDHLAWFMQRQRPQAQPSTPQNILAWVPPAAPITITDYLPWLAKTTALSSPAATTPNTLPWILPQRVGYGGDHLAWLSNRNVIYSKPKEIANPPPWMVPAAVGKGGDMLAWLPRPSQASTIPAPAITNPPPWLIRTSALVPLPPVILAGETGPIQLSGEIDPVIVLSGRTGLIVLSATVKEQ
jgi:hypothetical protein